MKKILSFLFIGLLVFVLVGCEKPGTDQPGDETKYSLSVADADKNVTLEVDGTKKISVAFEGAELVWAVDKNDIVSVKDGTITALKEGTAIITVSLKDHEDYKATITVTVNKKTPATIEVTGITLTGKKAEVEVDEEFTVVALVLPENATDKSVTWESSDATVASVTNGKVKALKVGTATITAKAGAKEESFTLTVKEKTPVVVEPEDIYLYHNKDSMFVGEYDVLEFGIDPEEASQEVIWTFDPEDAVELDGTKLYAKKAGTVTITMTSKEDSNLSESYRIRILDCFAVDGAKDSTLVPGKTIELTTRITGNDNTLTFTFASSDANVATVDANGLVTAVAAGEADITITSSDKYHSSISFHVIVKNSFVKIGDEIFEVTNGATINLEDKAYKGEVTVYASNFTLKGNGTVLEGLVYINDGLENVKFQNIKFTNGAAIDTPKATGGAALFDAEGLKGFTFENCTFERPSGLNDGCVHFFVPCEDFVFESCYFEFSTNRGIRFEAPIHNLTVNNCKFVNTSSHWDTLRAMDLIDGDVNVTNCHFENTLQSLIQFRYIGTGTYNVLNNTFKNAACVSIDMREAKVADFEGKAVINIKYNVFDGGANTWGTIRLRNSWASGKIENALEKVEVNFNYNKFLNITFGNNKYYVDKPTDNCTEGAWNLDYNYSDMGLPQLGENGQDNWFCNMQKSCEGWFETEEAFDSALFNAKINDDENILVVGTREGITKTTYETLAAALAAAKAGNQILLLPGAHTGDAKVSLDNITITSLNGDFVPGALVTRFDEATYAGKITIGKEVKNTVIKGIKFIGASQIVNEAGTAGTTETQALVGNNDGFTFINNYVESAVTGKGFIYFVEAGSAYSHDITISNNRFKAVTGFSSDAMVWVDNNYNLVACDNLFEDMTVTKAAFYVNDQTKGLSGEFSTLNNNVFKNITGSGLWINWLSPLPAKTDTCVVSIQNNTFENVSVNGIHVGNMNNADKYAAIKVMFNTFKDVATGIDLTRVHADCHFSCKYNTFVNVTGKYVNLVNSAGTPSQLDATDCLYLDSNETLVAPAADKFAGDVNYATTITSADDLPGFDAKATAIKINPIELFVGDEYQMTIAYTPKNTTNTGVQWNSSDPTVATIDANGIIKVLKAGTVTITATYKLNAELVDTLELTFVDFREVELYVEGNGFLKVNDELDIAAKIVGSNTTGEIEWSSSDDTVATVVAGKVTALKAGKATITAKIAGTELATNLVIEVNDLSEMDELIKLLVSGHRSVVEYQTINYIGYESGYEKVPHQVYTSVNDFYFAPLPEIQQNRNDHVLENTSGKMQSIEFVVVHDTGAAGPTSNARANSNWALNTGNTSTSYHYVVGNDGIFQQLDEDIIAWHAGDGASAGATTTFYDTGVTADPDLRKRPTVTVSDDGFFVVNGTKTPVAIPAGATKANQINDLGLATIVKDGKYFIPTTYVNSTYNNAICAKGGGTNGVGIESAVNTGSDVYLTWQRLAKLCADICIRNNLTPDRVFFHNNFSNKQCPNTMIHSDNIDMFLDMVYMEYYVRKNFSDYTITFKSNNPDIIDDSGRVIGVGPYKATNVSYTITIAKDGQTKTITLESLIQGSHKH